LLLSSLYVLFHLNVARVYPTEKEAAWERVWHKNCFKCSACNCVLTQATAYCNNATYALYCQTHYLEMDRRTGGLSSVSKDTYLKDGVAKVAIDEIKSEVAPKVIYFNFKGRNTL
jgi:hypothetical protein